MSRREKRQKPTGAGDSDRPAANRRRFLQVVGAASAAPFARGVLPALAALRAVPAAAQAPAKEETPPEVRPLLEVVKQRWGDRLDAGQLKAIEAELASTVRNSATLRGLKLQNSDEPAVIFRAEPAPEPAAESRPPSEAPR